MRIGIITFHASDNCGSMLQAYMLQHVLEKYKGIETNIINFSNENSMSYILYLSMFVVRETY